MPIYAFRCAACGHEFDRLQKLSDADPDTCPACGAAGEIGRKLTAPSFRLAGSGWYETDFKKDGDRKRNLAEGGEGAGSADGKPDGKPTGKPDSKSDGKSDGSSGSTPQAAKPADKAPATTPPPAPKPAD